MQVIGGQKKPVYSVKKGSPRLIGKIVTITPTYLVPGIFAFFLLYSETKKKKGKINSKAQFLSTSFLRSHCDLTKSVTSLSVFS